MIIGDSLYSFLDKSLVSHIVCLSVLRVVANRFGKQAKK
jgi:hypothetical protein